ncbi:MAG: RHS repeat-associated core domain-containing protein [Neisseria zoodegmatis]|uniref:RHS repeat domain-containing protein n=1 Tax=Neisseria zoodegmatis TaxID=326523 RepID=UPI0026EBA807|nr:RHS repeat-associated core domain-containing protein [Neisseria zoodegmatis]MDO5070148.1 RHS repeat-associated core domain-containing protein [Neisseria zoodegmatis]
MEQITHTPTPPKVMDNRVTQYNGINYYYDELGNIICREANGIMQNLYYDPFDQLIKIETFTKLENNKWEKDTWEYTYDALRRRVKKAQIQEDGTQTNITEFIWDGSHLIREVYANGYYTYIYTDVGSYEPLAQINNWTDAEGASHETFYYFHCDQAGSPREMTDKEGNLVWYGQYRAWGQLISPEYIVPNVHQPFRLQGQYYDPESGLHYNFHRYYDPNFGRFMTQDPIGLAGGSNAYFAFPNAQTWTDPVGLTGTYFMSNKNGGCYVGKGKKPRMNRSARERFTQDPSNPKTAKPDLCVHRDFGDDAVGLMVEHLLMKEFSALDRIEDGGCFNKINTFGAKLYGSPETYGITAEQKSRAKQQAKEMINDIKVGKCSLDTACPSLKNK